MNIQSQFLQKYGLWLAVLCVILFGALFGYLIAPKNTSFSLSQNPPFEEGVSEFSITNVDSTVTAVTNCTVSEQEIQETKFEKAVFDEINKYRQELGLTLLKDSPTLRGAAAWMSNDMASTKNFAHDDSTGRAFMQRIKDCGYSGGGGEILQVNPSQDAATLVRNWKNSDGHDKLMKNVNFRVMGVAHKNGYWTVDFGMKDDSGVKDPEPTKDPELVKTPTPTVTGTQPTQTPIPTQPAVVSPTATENPSSSGLLLSATLLGTTGGTSGNMKSMNGTVSVFDLSGQEMFQKTVTLVYNTQTKKFEGTASLPDQFENGNYNVKLKVENTLRKSISPYIFNIQSDQQNILPSVELVAGDLNNDNKITIQDYNLIVACTPLSSCKNMQYDLNYDGVITIEDYNVLLYAYSNILGE